MAQDNDETFAPDDPDRDPKYQASFPGDLTVETPGGVAFPLPPDMARRVSHAWTARFFADELAYEMTVGEPEASEAVMRAKDAIDRGLGTPNDLVDRVMDVWKELSWELPDKECVDRAATAFADLCELGCYQNDSDQTEGGE